MTKSPQDGTESRVTRCESLHHQANAHEAAELWMTASSHGGSAFPRQSASMIKILGGFRICLILHMIDRE
jgi:hypothetical protein